jgi:hypothetical protein
MTLKAVGLNLQIILVIVATGAIISVVDNILDGIRAAQSATEREMLFNQTEQGQEDIQNQVAQHNNETSQIFEKLTLGVDRQERLIALLEEELNNKTSTSPSS